MQETEEDIEPPTPLSKPKKPRSEAQIKAFEIAKQKRAANIAKQKENKMVESAKLILSKQPKETKQPVEIIEADGTESDSEPQPKPKVKSRKQIIIESSSESSESESSESESSESETEFIIKSRSRKSKHKQPTRITRVKRSNNIPEIVQNHPAPKEKSDYYNFFV
jgi:hypothetical protein